MLVILNNKMHKVSKNFITLGGIANALLLLNGCSTADRQNQTEASISQYQNKYIEHRGCSKVVLVGGCFDILHYGHIEFLKKAKAAGDYLIVALEPDESIMDYKRRLPTHNQQERAEILASLRYVDQVILLPVLKGFTDYSQLVSNIKPQVIAITADDPQINNKQMQADSVGATVTIVTPRLLNFSSTKIVHSQKAQIASS